VSVKWDEEGLECARERRRREREGRGDKVDGRTGARVGERERRKTSEGRKRTPLAAVFSLAGGEPEPEPEPEPDPHPHDNSSVGVGEEQAGDVDLEATIKKARPRRAVSEHLLGKGKGRPVGIYVKDGSGTGMGSLSSM
jgi:hypothetical protein